MSERKTTDNALEIIDAQIGDDSKLRQAIEREVANARVAQAIYDARKEAGLSQRELARLIGTSHSTIVRLEDADYKGHSLTMLTRIAAALGKHVQISLVKAA
ncbi:MAG: helix-turn-helix domain-containing protein [Armatimonadota bacterium]